MPELPDLQVFSKNLNNLFRGKKLVKISLKRKGRNKVTQPALKRALEGQRLKTVVREGKELHFKFGNNHVLGLHLMLRGQLHRFEKNNDLRFSIIEMIFDNGSGLALTDFQGQANATLDPTGRSSPDALSKEVNFKFLKEKFSRTKASVKNVLLDQDFIRGIGNAYADEILWDCKISPFSICKSIPDAQLRSLAKSIKRVLQKAERQILKKYPGIISGEVRDFMAVHNPKKELSPGGAPIEKAVRGARKTYFTREQILYVES